MVEGEFERVIRDDAFVPERGEDGERFGRGGLYHAADGIRSFLEKQKEERSGRVVHADLFENMRKVFVSGMALREIVGRDRCEYESDVFVPLQLRHDAPPELEEMERLRLVEVLHDTLLVGAEVHEFRRGLQGFWGRVFLLEAFGGGDDAGKQAFGDIGVHPVGVGFSEEVGEYFRNGRCGDIDDIELAEVFVFDVMVDIDDRHLVENIRIVFVEFADGFFVGRPKDDYEIEFELGRNEGEVARVDGAVFRSDVDAVLLLIGFGADGIDFVVLRVEGKDEIPRSRKRLDSDARPLEKRERCGGRYDGIRRDGHGFFLFFQKMRQCPGRSDRVAVKVMGEKDENIAGFADEFVELLLGIEGHVGMKNRFG